MARDILRHYSELFSRTIEERREKKKEVFLNRKHVYGPHSACCFLHDTVRRYIHVCIASLLTSRKIEEFSFAAVPAAVAHLPYLPTSLPTYIRYIICMHQPCINHAVPHHIVLLPQPPRLSFSSH
jgi:hypothetical protein